MKRERVYIASPLRGHPRGHEGAMHYLERCLRDSLERGEAPYAPHAYLPWVLDDDDEHDRKRGTRTGLAWLRSAERLALYLDHGESEGMRAERLAAASAGITIVERRIDG